MLVKGLLYLFLMILIMLVSFVGQQHKFLVRNFIFNQGIRHASYQKTLNQAKQAMIDYVSHHDLTIDVQRIEYHAHPRFLRIKARIDAFHFDRAVMEEINHE